MNTNEKHPVEIIAEACGGTITSGGILPDGSGFATMSLPLRKDHWIYGDGTFNVPPMPFRTGTSEKAVFFTRPAVLPTIAELEKILTNPDTGQGVPVTNYDMTRQAFADRIREAGKYAIKCATMDGKEMDFYPDAMLQNLVVGMIGYWTENGLTDDDWANPKDGGGANWTAPVKPAPSGDALNSIQT